MILTYLHGPIAEVCPHCFLSFSILAIFREKRVVKVGLKVKTLGQFLFYENSNLLNFFQTMLLLARVLPLVRILGMLDHIWGNKGQNPPEKGHFMNAESVRKSLKTFDLTTTTAILVKLLQRKVMRDICGGF